jgi:RimJ/RimL family protein N-acetyltransferase
MIIGSKVILRDKRLADAQDDYTWQTDPELAQLDAVPLLATTFSQYLADYVSELRYSSPTRCRFAIETLDGQHIGNCTYYGISEADGEAELGIMIGNRDHWDKGYGADAVTTLLSYIFRRTNLKRIYLKTLDSNHRAQRCFQKCGFIPYGHLTKDGFSFVLMEIHCKQWGERNNGRRTI